MIWTSRNEETMRLYIRQFITLAFSYVRAARWYKRLNFILNFISIFSAVYILPTAGCGLATGQVCTNLQWSGIIVGTISSVTNGLAYALNLPGKISLCMGANNALMQLAREISLELEKPYAIREDVVGFLGRIISKYESAVKGVTLPWYIEGEQQFANINLLQVQTRTYTTPAFDEENVTTVELTDQDRAVMSLLENEIRRLGSNQVYNEVIKLTP